ncbi:MAG: DNA replication/repair protein RecF [Gemmatimonadetes bacterium]|nr:DNA replication/repair protein RecF [Gemmatimonadota bacterium]
MRLSRLVLRHFRNLQNQELELPSEGVALIGDNAQGKSNFLEAIYYLETLRSFRSARDDQLVRFGEDVFRIVGTAESDGSAGDGDGDGGAEGDGDTAQGDRGGPTEIAAAFQQRGRKKKVTIDGQEAERLTDALGRLSAVIFSPADVELVSGGPSERRRFLDIVLSLNERGYMKSLQDYRKILQRRNAALKAGAPTSSVAAWEPGLVRSGAEVMAARRRWVHAKCAAFGDYYAAVSDEARAVMSYAPDVSIPPGAESEGAASTEEAIADAFREALHDSFERERRRGVTVVGPHRDDVRLRLEDGDEGMDLRDYGSGGQRRTAALALKLVEAMTIRQHRSRNPMILLDDVFAELDPGRSERVLELMEHEEIGQVVITAPKDADVRIRRDQLTRWRIADGVIEA